MKKLNKVIALALCLAMILCLAACSDGNGTATVVQNGDTEQGGVAANGDAAGSIGSTTKVHNGEITIGTWWTQHYDSADTALEDSADYTNAIDTEEDDEDTKKQNAINRLVAEKKFEGVKKIESKYDVKFYWKNLTYAGVQESINNSILAGSPDCDIYLVDSGMAYPAQANGLALDLKTVLPADHDLFTDQIVASYLDIGDGKACIIQRQGGMTNTYPLGFNVQMLEDNNLEDPRLLWERGEWTWEKFNEYCKVLTQDTDGDGQLDQYGFCGYAPDTFEQLMMSNSALIAAGTEQTLTDSKVAEALQELQDLFNTYNVCYPYDFTDSASDSMRNQYCEGNIGFFPIACWIQSGNGNYDWDGSLGADGITWDTAYVRWPVGPSGNKDTNPGLNNTGAELYMIPAGVQEPEVVFGVLYDMWNWYDLDVNLRDDPATYNWWYTTTGNTKEKQEANFAVQQDCMSHQEVDMWQNLGFYYDLNSVIDGTVTPAQFQETYKQQVQDGLDNIFGN